MKLEMNYYKKTNTIKEAFTKEFPFLKIEFFKKKHKAGEPSPALQMIQGNKTLGLINPDIKDGFLSFEPGDTVTLLEQKFENKFGLPVQVLRKQKSCWIETTKTDHLTLAQQNEMGKNASVTPAHVEVGDRYLEDGQY